MHQSSIRREYARANNTHNLRTLLYWNLPNYYDADAVLALCSNCNTLLARGSISDIPLYLFSKDPAIVRSFSRLLLIGSAYKMCLFLGVTSLVDYCNECD
jgi:hypothetical protein